MSDLAAQFAQAQREIQPESPDNNTKLKLYALYKQATLGDAAGERPGAFDFVARAKFDAWSAVKGTSAEEAMRQYVAMVNTVLGR
ncbi:MAG TPA: acyl-CoA-binding protein [Solibacterales bacterium]|nr:acyl-CoA-binding protein [Bryobacterales bacterium]